MGALIFLIFVCLLFVVGTPIFDYFCDRAEKKRQEQWEEIKKELQRHKTFEENLKQTEGWYTDDNI